MNMPKTTYTFSSWTVDEYGDDKEVKIEFTTQEETLTDMCEKFGDFLRATGFSYVKDVVAYDTWEDERYEDSNPDISLDYSDEQPDLFGDYQTMSDSISLGDINLGSVNVDDNIDITTGGSVDYTLTSSYPDVTVTYGNSIDDATPEEWNAVNASIYGKKF